MSVPGRETAFMAPAISDILLSQFSEFVGAQMGLHFPKERWHDLKRGVSSAARESGFNDSSEYVHWLLTSPLKKEQVEFLASHLTVGETYFFRELHTFGALEKEIIPDLIRARETDRRLRIWSAGCCSGEEPYSIAILLRRLIPHFDPANITILATDINPRFLEKAAKGIYGQWSLRETQPWIREQYFKKVSDGGFALQPSVRKMVSFAYLNLAEDIYPSLLNNTNAMDLILCRNVLMYFSSERARHVVERLYRSLVDGGWLVVSPSETSHVLFSRFAAVDFGDAIVYRKTARPDVQVRHIDLRPLELPPQETPIAAEFTPFPVPEIELESPEPSPSPPRIPSYSDALNLYNQGGYEEAASILQSILTAEKEHAAAMALLARIYANQGDLEEALQWCERALAIEKLSPAHRYLLGTILFEQGRFNDAIDSLKRSLYLDHDFTLAHVALGNLLRQQGKWEEAVRHFQNALSSLEKSDDDRPVPESEGLTAGRLRNILETVTTQTISEVSL